MGAQGDCSARIVFGDFPTNVASFKEAVRVGVTAGRSGQRFCQDYGWNNWGPKPVPAQRDKKRGGLPVAFGRLARPNRESTLGKNLGVIGIELAHYLVGAF
jgi:hypothetical protein